MNKPKILLIVPAYNEEKNILQTYNTIINYNKKNKTNYDVIVINDGSIDDTSYICKKNKIPTINLIHNLGIGGAVQTGYKYAYKNDYDIAIQFDGDGQHSIGSIKNLIDPIIDNKADFVLGSRFVNNNVDNFKSSLARRIGIRIISWFIKLITGKRVYDTTSGFRACNKNIIKLFANEYPTEYPEPITNTKLLKMKYRFKEVHADMKEREAGKSSIHSWKSFYYMINVILSILVCGIRRYK
jgi:glycosyltransferase involved in cell wall biosynthesis